LNLKFAFLAWKGPSHCLRPTADIPFPAAFSLILSPSRPFICIHFQMRCILKLVTDTTDLSRRPGYPTSNWLENCAYETFGWPWKRPAGLFCTTKSVASVTLKCSSSWNVQMKGKKMQLRVRSHNDVSGRENEVLHIRLVFTFITHFYMLNHTPWITQSSIGELRLIILYQSGWFLFCIVYFWQVNRKGLNPNTKWK